MRLRLLAALGAFVATAAAAQVAVPPLTTRVTDLTGTLSAGQIAALEQRLAAFEQRKGSQVAVLIVPTTQPEEIEQYATRVFDEWKLGRKGVDDGVLLLVAKNDRRMKIEVGYGFEGALPDAIAKRIISETLTPYFRSGDFHGGISAGIDQILRVIDGEKLPEPHFATPEQGLGVSAQYLFAVALFMLGFVRPVGRAIGEFPATLAGGGVYGAICWVLAGAFAGMFGALVFTVLALFVLASRGARYTGVGTLGDGFGGRGGGSSWGGGSSGGGGFSGGGGRSGGGGASGSW